jgi:SAM-dependent methyltransferase
MDTKEKVKSHFTTIAAEYDYWKKKNSYYYSSIKDFFRSNIPTGSRVIEFGCATGEILAHCRPANGLGLDLCADLIERAKAKFPQYGFQVQDVEKFVSDEKFDYCIMADLLDHITDIPAVIGNAYNSLNPGGKLAISTINPLWNPVFALLEKLRLKMPEGPHCFIPNRYLEFFCRMAGFEVISKGSLLFIPVRIPLLSGFLNFIMPRLPLVYRFCWVQTLVVKKVTRQQKKMSCSVMIPVYNEADNIEECIRRIPALDRDYEILVINDGSQDRTGSILERLTKEIPQLRVVTFPENRGKAHAVEEGISAAQKEIIIILDADMAVAPEDIELFIEPLEMGLADFVNGTRLIYTMEKKAMDQIRQIANFSLALLFSFCIKSRITDTLCGTKSFFKKDFQGITISEERWGDLVLLWSAREKGLNIAEIPVNYYTRKSGESKMKFLSDGMKFMSYTVRMACKSLFSR